MREIKYRLWNPCRKGYHYDIDTVMDCLKQQSSGLYDHEKEYGGVFEQYTGLKDKNGVKIFEGDYIKVPNDWNQFGLDAGEVYNIYFAFGGFRMKPKYDLSYKGFWIEDDNLYEVVGNIFDNPELLEV